MFSFDLGLFVICFYCFTLKLKGTVVGILGWKVCKRYFSLLFPLKLFWGCPHPHPLPPPLPTPIFSKLSFVAFPKVAQCTPSWKKSFQRQSPWLGLISIACFNGKIYWCNSIPFFFIISFKQEKKWKYRAPTCCRWNKQTNENTPDCAIISIHNASNMSFVLNSLKRLLHDQSMLADRPVWVSAL